MCSAPNETRLQAGILLVDNVWTQGLSLDYVSWVTPKALGRSLVSKLLVLSLVAREDRTIDILKAACC